MHTPILTYRRLCEEARALQRNSASVGSVAHSTDLARTESVFLMSKGCRVTKDGSFRSSRRMNLGGYITDLNLANSIDLERFPTQQRMFIQLASVYCTEPEMLPYVGTDNGYAPTTHRRSIVSSVLKVVIAHTCFHTWRIGRYTPKGFQEISLLELARIAGFTYWKDGSERIERSFSRAYEQFAKGYIFSHQTKGRTLRSRSGWKRASRYVSKRLFQHMIEHFPAYVTQESFEELTKAAKARYRRIGSKRPVEQDKTQGLLARIKKQFQSDFDRLTSRLTKLGFATESATEAAFLALADLISDDSRSRFGPPV